MDGSLLSAYVNELEALRVHGREFAREYPDIASRLDIGPQRSRDPHAERVIESTAFLAGRIRLMIEENAAEVPAAMLAVLAPTLVEPVPSLATIELVGGSESQAVPRGTRFDFYSGGQAMVCMTTTMDTVAYPGTVTVKRIEGTNHADGLSLKFSTRPTGRVVFCVGNDELSAAGLIDALDNDLASIEYVPPDGDPVPLPPTRIVFHGFPNNEAALPVYPNVHPAYRVVGEFLAFPEKFRFVSIRGMRYQANSEIRFYFKQPLPFEGQLPRDLISVNKVPAINMWPSTATPFDIVGRELEYPVRVDALRYRTVECHAVRHVEMFDPNGGKPQRIDPIVGHGEVLGTQVRWGTRRSLSRAGGEIMMYFRGLDYRQIGQQRFLVAPHVYASNRDIAQRVRAGARLTPTESLADWRGRLVGAPSSYMPAIASKGSIEGLISYVRSSASSLILQGGDGLLRDYLRSYPGGASAGWIDGLKAVDFEAVASGGGGSRPEAGVSINVTYDGERYRATSRAMVRRVLGGLFDSQRGINRVEEVVVNTT